MRISRGPNVWRLDRLLSVPQIDLSARADRKMVIFYVYLHYFTKKSRLYRTDTQIKKSGVQRKHLHTPSYAYLRICIFSKEITALGCDFFAPIHKYTSTQRTVFRLCECFYLRNRLLCICFAKKVISLDQYMDTHTKWPLFYLCILFFICSMNRRPNIRLFLGYQQIHRH